VDKHDMTLKYTSHILPSITQVTVHCFRITSCTWRNFRKCDCSLARRDFVNILKIVTVFWQGVSEALMSC